MKPLVAGVVASILLTAVTGAASAEERLRLKVPIEAGRAAVTAHDALPGGEPPARLIYLNDCKPDGCTVQPGFESSIDDTSSIIDQTISLSPFEHSDAVWNEVVACVRETFAPYDIDVVTEDPGNAPHWEDIVAGTPGEAGFDAQVGGVSPWDPIDCSIIDNSITYTFANAGSGNAVRLCWTVSQEVAHSFGLDHEYLREDPMTYLSGSSLPGGVKRFQDIDADCGEYEPRLCECTTTQNSHQMLLGIFGSSMPTPPEISFITPTDGMTVGAGFAVRVEVLDDEGVASVSLAIDGQTIDTITSPPYVFDTPATLADGAHTLLVRAVDAREAEGTAEIQITIGAPCETPADCEAQGDDLTCVGGQCVPDEGADGGLGDPCADDSECLSGRCETSTTGESYCVEPCALDGDDCPGGFQCLGDGFCWPGDDGSILGGCGASSHRGGGVPILPLALGAGFAVLVLRRRRA